MGLIVMILSQWVFRVVIFGQNLKNHQFWLKFEKSIFAKNLYLNPSSYGPPIQKIINFGQNLKYHQFWLKYEKSFFFCKKIEKSSLCKNICGCAGGVCGRSVRVCRKCVRVCWRCVQVCRRCARNFPCWDLNALVIWSPIQVLMRLNAA